MDEYLTEEQLRILVDNDELFDEYDFSNIYSVESKGIEKKCSVCSLSYNENKELFYGERNSLCKKCNTINTKKYYYNNREKMNEYSRNYNNRRNSRYTIGE
jgi:hypothetical protein